MKRRIVRRVRLAGSAAAIAHGQGGGLRPLSNRIFNQFNPSLLGLGDINTPCQEKEAVAAVFDLTGFTTFCNQVDAYLAIPSFLNSFLDWFFNSIIQGLTDDDGQNTYFWSDLPILVKFLGDGILVVWNAHRMGEDQICRLTATLYNICYAYRQDFYPQIKMTVNKPPGTLRCGLGRGKVFSVGNGSDYVGHCINNASRLCNLSPLTFCFPNRGFSVREHMPPKYAQLFVPKYATIRGVDDNELIWVVKEEFNSLAETQRMQFRSIESVMV